MEKYGSKENFSIVSISRSKEGLGVEDKSVPQEGVKYALASWLALEEKKKDATTILIFQFFTRDKQEFSNKLVINVKFHFDDELPIVNDGKGNVNVSNYEQFVSIFDTSIGIFRGILSEWLAGSKLQRAFPLVDILEFVKHVKVFYHK